MKVGDYIEYKSQVRHAYGRLFGTITKVHSNGKYDVVIDNVATDRRWNWEMGKKFEEQQDWILAIKPSENIDTQYGAEYYHALMEASDATV